MESAVDKATVLVQQVDAQLARALQLKDEDPANSLGRMPTKSTLAGKFLGFDSNGDPIAASGTSANLTAVSDFINDNILGAGNAAAARAALDAEQDVFTTRGDVLYEGASAPARLAIGASGYRLGTDGTDPVWQESPMPRGHLWGLTLSNDAGRPTLDVNVTAGECRDTANGNNITLATEITKQTDADWAEGDDAGGFPQTALTLTANTGYHVHLLLNATTGAVDMGFDTSVTAVNLLADAAVFAAGYTKYRRIGAIRTAAAATTILGFTHYHGGEFWLDVPVLDVTTTNPGTAAVTETLTTVPIGVAMKAIVNVFYDGGSSSGAAYLSPLDTTDAVASVTAAPLGTVGFQDLGVDDGIGQGPVGIWTNTSAQIRSRVSNSSASTRLEIATLGWIDTRGRDA